jgi:hypothetical protein
MCKATDDGVSIVLNISKDQFEKAPALKKAGYRDLLDEAFVRSTTSLFGERTEIETEAPRGKAQEQGDRPERKQPRQ